MSVAKLARGTHVGTAFLHAEVTVPLTTDRCTTSIWSSVGTGRCTRGIPPMSRDGSRNTAAEGARNTPGAEARSPCAESNGFGPVRRHNPGNTRSKRDRVRTKTNSFRTARTGLRSVVRFRSEGNPCEGGWVVTPLPARGDSRRGDSRTPRPESLSTRSSATLRRPRLLSPRRG